MVEIVVGRAIVLLGARRMVTVMPALPVDRAAVMDFDRCYGANYRGIATWAGYAHPREYARDHDLTHSWLAARRDQPGSPALLASVGIDQDPGVVAAEEFDVNALQRVLRGVGDAREVARALEIGDLEALNGFLGRAAACDPGC